MKVFYLFLPVLLFLAVGLHAQQFSGGVRAGLVGSQVAGDTYSGYHKAGINPGVWVSLATGKRSSVQMELGYIQKGSRENPDFERNRFDTYIMRLGYIELPFLYRINYNELLGFEAGLAMNFLIHQRETFNGGETTGSPFRGQNLCFAGGMSIRLNERIRFNVRTDNSLFSIRKNRVSGDVWRFWGYGQFSDALILSAYYTL
jgi:hypothetical protein